VSQDHLALHRLKDAAERFKIQLDSIRTVEETLPFLTAINGRPFHSSLKLSRDSLERLFAKLIERTVEPCRQALSDSEEKPTALILVGGMSRMPLVQNRIGEFFGLAPERHHDPSRVVAQTLLSRQGFLLATLRMSC